jgi:undecaprenyl-diphosphatase
VGDSRLAWAVIFGTIPVGLAGLLFNGLVETALRNPLVIAATTIVFGLLLGWADWRGQQQRNEHQLRWQDILFIGVAQAIALIPGTSRSGITITAGLMLGLTRNAAARFSFLLSIPVIFLAGGLKTLELVQSNLAANWFALISGAVFSAASAYICIFLFLKMLERIGMWPFVIYRLLLGGLLLWLFL